MQWCDPTVEALVKQLLWAKERLGLKTFTRRRIAEGVGLARATVDSIATGRIGWPARWLARKGPVTAGQRRRRRNPPPVDDQESVEFQKVKPYRCPNGHGLMRFSPCVQCVVMGMVKLPPQKAMTGGR